MHRKKEGNGLIRLSQVQFEMAQHELEEAVNTVLPPGFFISAVHVTPHFVLCTVHAKAVKVDVKLEVALDEQAGQVIVRIHASKWFLSLDFVLTPLLKAITSDERGIYAHGTNLLIDLHKLLHTYLDAESFHFVLEDGFFTVFAKGVQLTLESSAVV